MLIRFTLLLSLAAFLLGSSAVAQSYLGQFSSNPYALNSVANPYSTYGSRYSGLSVNNPYGTYGSPYSSTSATNPYATRPPMLFDAAGNFRGTLSNNRYDPYSISNPYGVYGSRYSPLSVNNPYGAGSRYSFDSPMNPYGSGWDIYGQ